jgi:hypothetical protein
VLKSCRVISRQDEVVVLELLNVIRVSAFLRLESPQRDPSLRVCPV